MTHHDELPRDIVWQDDGHLSEVALTALADGEDAIIPADAHAHLAGCDACARAVGDAAMLSTALGDALRKLPERRELAARSTSQPAPVSSRPEVRLPWRALAAGLAFALIGAIPMLLRVQSLFDYARFLASRGAPMLLRGGLALVRSFGGPQQIVLVLTSASALVLVCAAAFVARRAAHSKDVGNEGVSR